MLNCRRRHHRCWTFLSPRHPKKIQTGPNKPYECDIFHCGSRRCSGDRNICEAR